MANQSLVLEGGLFGGRQSGQKCGDVDESMSDYGNHPFLARFFKKSLFTNMKESARNFLVAQHVTKYSRDKNIHDGNHYV